MKAVTIRSRAVLALLAGTPLMLLLLLLALVLVLAKRTTTAPPQRLRSTREQSAILPTILPKLLLWPLQGRRRSWARRSVVGGEAPWAPYR